MTAATCEMEAAAFEQAERWARARFVARLIPPDVDLRFPIRVALALMEQRVSSRDINEVLDAAIVLAAGNRIEGMGIMTDRVEQLRADYAGARMVCARARQLIREAEAEGLRILAELTAAEDAAATLRHGQSAVAGWSLRLTSSAPAIPATGIKR